MLEDAEIEEPPAVDSCLKETAPVNPKISQESAPTQVYMSHVAYPEVTTQPTQLQECIKTDVLEGVDHTKSQSSTYTTWSTLENFDIFEYRAYIYQ